MTFVPFTAFAPQTSIYRPLFTFFSIYVLPVSMLLVEPEVLPEDGYTAVMALMIFGCVTAPVLRLNKPKPYVPVTPLSHQIGIQPYFFA